MSRVRRIFLNNACYHIMARGNRKQLTFLEEEDFEKYLELVRHYKYKFGFLLYAYCLMPNHIHLVLQIRNGKDLSRIIQGLNLSYTIWFNGKYKKVGHLWQGRYKSKIIEMDKYLLDCIQYVELNPIRSKMASSPSEYRWSSWRNRLSDEKVSFLNTPEIIGSDESQGHFSD